MFFRKHFYFFRTILFSIFFLLVSFQSGADAAVGYQTNLLAGEYIQDSSGDIDVGIYSVPVVYDWNSDGAQDLLVGQRFDDAEGSHGYVSYFENTGTNASPSLSSPTYMQACSSGCTLDVAAGG